MRDAVASDYMPYVTLKLDPPVEPLSCEEKATLLAWLDAGAPPPPETDPTCTASPPALRACDDSSP
jgi:hypothetical protein